MNETLDLPLFDLSDAHLSALGDRRRLGDEESCWLMRLRGSN